MRGESCSARSPLVSSVGSRPRHDSAVNRLGRLTTFVHTSNTVCFSRNRHSLEREKKEQRAVSRPTEQLCRVCQISEARSAFRDKCSATRRSSGRQR